MNLKELEDFQYRHDIEYHKDIMTSSSQLQIEHCALHKSKTAGILCDFAEKAQHGDSIAKDQIRERLADDLAFLLKLVRLFEIADFEKLYLARMAVVEARKVK